MVRKRVGILLQSLSAATIEDGDSLQVARCFIGRVLQTRRINVQRAKASYRTLHVVPRPTYRLDEKLEPKCPEAGHCHTRPQRL